MPTLQQLEAAIDLLQSASPAEIAALSPAYKQKLADQNSDGVVNVKDTLATIGAYGAIAPPPVIPPVQPPTSGVITWIGASGMQYSITPLPASTPITLTAGINPAGQRGKTYTGAIPGNPNRVLSVEGSSADLTEIRMQSVSCNWREYGGWIAGKRITLDGCDWQCLNPITETYSIRDYSSELVVMNSQLDNSVGWKRSVRKIQGRAAFVGCTLKGGAFEIGNPDATPNNTDVSYLLIRGGSITKVSDPMHFAVRVCNGAGDIVLEDVNLDGNDDCWYAIDVQGTFTGNLIFRRVTWGGFPLKINDIAFPASIASRVKVQP